MEERIYIPQVIEPLVRKVTEGERISVQEAEMLWHEASLSLLGKLASDIKRKKSGNKVYYNRNIHIEPTNLCMFNCRFCSYRRDVGSPEAWDLTMEEVETIARRHVGKGITEVHIVGGVHPEHDLYYYADMIRRVRDILPGVTVKAFTAIELAYMIDKAGLTDEQGIMVLKDAGMGAMAGGGAEIFDREIRAKICPEKGSSERWLSLHEAAHWRGISTNATILYGHIESVKQRLDHLDRLRTLQDRTGGFNAFIPLKYRSSGNSMRDCGEVPVTEDMRMIAISRIFLDNFPHIKAYWPMYGFVATEMALMYGADDIDGTIDDTTRIYSMAGGEKNPRLTVDAIERMTAYAGLRAVERDTFYNEL